MSQSRLLSVLVENKPGVLQRVASMIRRRGFNIDSLSVGPTEDETVSRMTIAVCCVASSLTGSVLNSTQPIQSGRPLATMTGPLFLRLMRCPRF